MRRRAWLCMLAVSFAACERDRVPVPEPPPDQVTMVWLTSLPLDSDRDYDRLDLWLRGSGSADDTVRLYDDLLRLAPDHVKAHVRAALAVLALDEERGRAVARGVLDRFRDRIATDEDLRALSSRLGGGEPQEGDAL